MRFRLAACLLAAMFAPGASAFAALNLFEWSAVAPIVAEVQVRKMDGRYARLGVAQVLRGELRDDMPLLVDLGGVNRRRNRSIGEKPLRMEEGERYVILLSVQPRKAKSKLPVYDMVRGVRGARSVPLEGEAAFFDALQSFIEIHELRSDTQTWDRFGSMLTERNPIKLQTALQQFLKFRRGKPDLVAQVRPLLRHPRPDFRENAALLLGQIVQRHHPESISEVETLRNELVGSARRDEEVTVRAAATQALAGFSDDAMQSILEEISEDDADQTVRYAAEKLLYERRRQQAAAREDEP